MTLVLLTSYLLLVFLSVSELLPTAKSKFHPMFPGRTPVKSNNPLPEEQAVLLSQPAPPTLLSLEGHYVPSSVSKNGAELTLDLSFSKHFSKAVTATGFYGRELILQPTRMLAWGLY